MARFFVAPTAISAGRVTLEGGDAHHAATVLRLKVGARVTVLDGLGRVLDCVVEDLAKKQVTLRVTGEAAAPEAPVTITLYQGLPKGDKFELIIQKATELGVARIIPLAALRSVAKVEPGKVAAKQARWQAIAREAAEQSERPTVPLIDPPATLASLTLPPGTLALTLAEREDTLTLPRALPEVPPTELALFVGPEGGWDPAELAALDGLGATAVTLGPRILRTETAGLAALAIVMAKYELG